jgi:hypothetical protein
MLFFSGIFTPPASQASTARTPWRFGLALNPESISAVLPQRGNDNSLSGKPSGC